MSIPLRVIGMFVLGFAFFAAVIWVASHQSEGFPDGYPVVEEPRR